MNLVIQQCLDWDYVLLVDKDAGKTVVRFVYDDQAGDAMTHVVRALKYVGVDVGEENIPVREYARDANGRKLMEGCKVVTKVSDKASGDFAKSNRQFGTTGVIMKEHNSHGLYYDVRHSDMSTGCYESCELIVVR